MPEPLTAEVAVSTLSRILAHFLPLPAHPTQEVRGGGFGAKGGERVPQGEDFRPQVAIKALPWVLPANALSTLGLAIISIVSLVALIVLSLLYRVIVPYIYRRLPFTGKEQPTGPVFHVQSLDAKVDESCLRVKSSIVRASSQTCAAMPPAGYIPACESSHLLATGANVPTIHSVLLIDGEV
jgi:hypothetical protein